MDGLTISIVTYNSKDLFKTLDSLEKIVMNNSDFEVVVYDNASVPEYRDRIKKYDFVHLIEAEENQGFGHGHNQVLKQSSNRYGLICNPDILVEPGTVEKMIDTLQTDSSLAAVVPKVLNEDGSTQYLVRQKLDVFDYFLRFIPFKFVKRIFDKRLSFFECRDLSDTTNTDIKMGSGCFMLVDITKFNGISGFDERYFMYFEDNDLSLRFGQAGYRIRYVPSLSVVHLYGKGAHRSRKLFIIFMQSMVRFFNKWGWRFF